MKIPLLLLLFTLAVQPVAVGYPMNLDSLKALMRADIESMVIEKSPTENKAIIERRASDFAGMDRGLKNFLIGYGYRILGVYYSINQDLKNAVWASKEALRYQTDKEEILRVKYNLAGFEEDRGLLLNSEKYHMEAIELARQPEMLASSGLRHYYPMCLMELGRVYAKTGELFKGKDRLELALAIQTAFKPKPTDSKNWELLGKIYHELGTLLRDAGDYTAAKDTLFKAVTIFQQIESEEIIKSYRSLGDVFDLSGDYPQAILFYGKALEEQPEVSDSVGILNNRGITYRKQKQFTKSYQDLLAAQRLCRDYELQAVLAMTFDNLADLRRDQGQVADALPLYQRAISLTAYGWESTDPRTNPPARSLRSTILKPDLLVYLADKADCWTRMPSEKIYLEQALRTFRVVDTLIDLMQSEFSQERTKLYWRTEVKPIYERALEVCYRLGDQESFFHFLEKSKSVLLLEQLNINTLRSQLPPEIAAQELTLREKIANMRLQLDEANRSQYPRILESLLRLEEELHTLLREQLDLDADVIAFEQARANLPDDRTLLVHYFYGKENLFLFAFRKDGEVEWEMISRPSLLREQIREFIEELKRGIQNANAFHQSAYYLYNKLYASILAKWNTFPAQAIIIPDDSLCFVPFDALITSLGGENLSSFAQPYLIKQQQTRYAYSATTLAKLIGHSSASNRRKAKLFGVFPSFENGAKEFFRLELDEELKTAILAFDRQAKLLEGAGVTASHFQETAPKYDFIHLHTHANALKPYPEIYLNMDTLVFPQITGLRLDGVNEVLLIVCGGSSGEIKPGEGVYSLATGFTYAGARSLISNIWDTDPTVAEDLFSKYYHFLRLGESKSSALHKAKLAFYEERVGEETSSPYFWAGFLFIGQDAEVLPRTGWPPPIAFGFILGGVIGILFIVLARRSRRKKNY